MARWGTGRKDDEDTKADLSNPPEKQAPMKERNGSPKPLETAISIVGPGMKIVGDCITDGTVRIEGRVEGSVQAGKAVVVGKDGTIEGNVETQDAVISGVVTGTINAESRLELQSTCRIEGEVYARRMQLEEGAILNGRVQMGEKKARSSVTSPSSSSSSSQDSAKSARTPAKASAS